MDSTGIEILALGLFKTEKLAAGIGSGPGWNKSGHVDINTRPMQFFILCIQWLQLSGVGGGYRNVHGVKNDLD